MGYKQLAEAADIAEVCLVSRTALEVDWRVTRCSPRGRASTVYLLFV